MGEWWADLRSVSTYLSPGVGLFMAGYHHGNLQIALWVLVGWVIIALYVDWLLGAEERKEERQDNGNDRQ